MSYEHEEELKYLEETPDLEDSMTVMGLPLLLREHIGADVSPVRMSVGWIIPNLSPMGRPEPTEVECIIECILNAEPPVYRREEV